MNKGRVIVAMSGGVDSSVAAALLVDQGYEVIGITMKTWGYMEQGGAPKFESGCCSLDAIFDAKNVANQLGFPHYTVDFTSEFEEAVIDDFVHEYLNGRTPNPCVMCNRKIKWEELLKKADDLDAEFVSTGHYAATFYNESTGRYVLKNSSDEHKDQTYALWALTQNSLKRTLLPLAGITKPRVREIAQSIGLKTAQKPDSQEICFVADNNYERFIHEKLEGTGITVPEGDIVYEGKPIGRHRGVAFYTIGQRKGLGIALGKPVYVTGISTDENRVYIGEKTDLLKYDLSASQVNYVSTGSLREGDLVRCKIRYADKGSEAVIVKAGEDSFHLKFVQPKSAITPGQSAVLYDADGCLLAGGIID